MDNLTRVLGSVKEDIRQVEVISQVLSAVLHAADPALAVQANLRINGNTVFVGKRAYSFDSNSRLVLIALGKAAEPMMLAAAEIFTGWKYSGLCITKHPQCLINESLHITTLKGDHPIPAAGSLAAGEAIREVVGDLRDNDLVILLLSGGGSSLAVLPREGIFLEEIQALTDSLLRTGKSINEINTVRKHLEQLKGGGLLRLVYPARVAALILSDVVGNPLDVIASGPTTADPSTFAQALRIVEDLPPGERQVGIFRYLQQGMEGKYPETIKTDNVILQNSHNLIIGSNLASCKAAADSARKLGFPAKVVTTRLVGEASLAGARLARYAQQISSSSRNGIFVFGGETTVTVKGNGLGGRNLETALGAVKGIAGLPDIVLLAFGTDGDDGPTGAAGALVTSQTYKRALEYGLTPEIFLAVNDSYHFFERSGNLLVTGPTGTNVNDISILFNL